MRHWGTIHRTSATRAPVRSWSPDRGCVCRRAGQRPCGACDARAWLSRDEEFALRYTGESWDPLVVAAYLNTTPDEVQSRLHSAARKLSAVLASNGDSGTGEHASGPDPENPPPLTVAKQLDDE